MRYEGRTLREALGKALGTRDQYGRKIVRAPGRRAILAAPTQKSIRTIQPAGTPVDISPGNLQRLRREAIERAKSSALANANLEPSAMEEGFMSLYFVDNGELLDFDGADAGQGFVENGKRKFRYNADRYTSRPFWVLCWAHSHPEEGSAGDQSYLRGLSRPDDYGLRRTAPVLIYYPPHNWWPHPGSSYRQFST